MRQVISNRQGAKVAKKDFVTAKAQRRKESLLKNCLAFSLIILCAFAPLRFAKKKLLKQRRESARRCFDIRLPEHAMNNGQHIGAGVDEQAAIVRGDAADGNQGQGELAAR